MRCDSNTHFHIPISLDSHNVGVEAQNFKLNKDDEDELEEIENIN